MPIFRVYNGPMPTTGVIAPVALVAATLKTLLQLKSVAGLLMKVKAWGISFDGAAGAAGVQCELLETGTIFGTVTPYAAADLQAIDAGAKLVTSTDYLSVGTSASGYTCTSEGSIVAARVFDDQIVQPTGQYAWEFSLGNEPVVSPVSALRIRAKAPAGVNALCWVQIEM